MTARGLYRGYYTGGRRAGQAAGGRVISCRVRAAGRAVKGSTAPRRTHRFALFLPRIPSNEIPHDLGHIAAERVS